MNILISIIWIVFSITAIAIDDHIARWNGLYKIFITASIIAMIFNGWQLYDSDQSIIVGIVELNPSWDRALLLSFLEGICITGPIAAVHALQDYLYYKHKININPFKKER
jgi:hypothetical protein